MAAVVTAVAGVCSGGGHGTITATIDGEAITVRPEDLSAPLTTAEKTTLLLLTARLLRQKGVSVANFLNRVLLGDEATNVKVYDLIAPGGAITKTNIGTSYVNVCPGANGERILVDFTGCTEFRVILSANLIGTGAFGARIVRDSNNDVLFENANIALTGERELDTDWVPLSGVATAFNALTLIRLQAKSATAADDPVFRRCQIAVR